MAITTTNPNPQGQTVYFGLAADTKPAAPIAPGSKFIETDTGKAFVWTGGAWIRDPYANTTPTVV